MTMTLPPPFVSNHATLAPLTPRWCYICYQAGVNNRATFDASIRNGPWAYLCTHHFIYFDCNTGLGRGQALIEMPR